MQRKTRLKPLAHLTNHTEICQEIPSKLFFLLLKRSEISNTGTGLFSQLGHYLALLETIFLKIHFHCKVQRKKLTKDLQTV